MNKYIRNEVAFFADPVVELVREWFALEAIVPQDLIISDRMRALSQSICSEVPKTTAGISSVMRYLLFDFEEYYSDNTAGEVDKRALENIMEGARIMSLEPIPV